MILQYFISYYFVYDTIQFISCGKTTLWLVKMLWLAGSSKRPKTVIKDNLKSAEITIMFNKKEPSSSNIKKKKQQRNSLWEKLFVLQSFLHMG